MTTPRVVRHTWQMPPRRPPGQGRRLLHDPVRDLVGDLSRDFGKCFATEAGMRRELWRRTGYLCGERSIGRCIARAVRRGELGHKRIVTNEKMCNGKRSKHGTTHTWIIARADQRKARRRAREAQRQAKYARQRQERAELERERRRREDEARARAPSTRAAWPIAAALPLPEAPRGAPGQPPRAPLPGPEVSSPPDVQAEVARQLEALRKWSERPPDK